MENMEDMEELEKLREKKLAERDERIQNIISLIRKLCCVLLAIAVLLMMRERYRIFPLAQKNPERVHWVMGLLITETD